MKKFLSITALLAAFSFVNAQCTADYDFGEAGFGVSPDPVIGEQFVEGEIGVPYEDVIHMLVPVNAGDLGDDVIPPEWADFASMIDIDSLSLVSVEVLIDDVFVDISNLGLEADCNNGGDSVDPCTFLGGQQYCAAIVGTPNQAGEFQMRITVNIYFEFFSETQEVPQTFEDDYFLTITDGMSVGSIDRLDVNVSQNTPNPFSGKTTISFTMSQASDVTFKVSNLLGESIYREELQALRGANTWNFDASGLNAGIYLYSMEAGQQKVTKRMIVR